MSAPGLDHLIPISLRRVPRRALVRVVALLPGLGAVMEQERPEDIAARKRGKRRRCKAKSRGKICSSKCGIVKSRKTCGKKVDCGVCCGTSGVACSSREICVDSACIACDVICEAPNRTCSGGQLQSALAAGGTIHICPGRYTGEFTISQPVSLVGAGNGDDPATSTILDGLGERVVLVDNGMNSVAATLKNLRITGGVADDGAGIRIRAAAEVDLISCAITENNGDGGSDGGGVESSGTLRLTDCLVERNSATDGGGIKVNSGLTILRNTIVQNNVADDGGGILVEEGSLVLEPGTLVIGNSAPIGGGISSDAGTSVTISAGARVAENNTANCAINGTISGTCFL
jgi:hypothetical protein